MQDEKFYSQFSMKASLSGWFKPESGNSQNEIFRGIKQKRYCCWCCWLLGRLPGKECCTHFGFNERLCGPPQRGKESLMMVSSSWWGSDERKSALIKRDWMVRLDKSANTCGYLFPLIVAGYKSFSLMILDDPWWLEMKRNVLLCAQVKERIDYE